MEKLEQELKRYKKKVADQQKEIQQLKYIEARALEVHKLTDMALVQVLLTFGTEDAEDGEVIGRHIHGMDKPRAETLEEWEVHSNFIDGKWNLGMVKRAK